MGLPDRATRPYTFWWVFQRFSGLVLVVTVIAHMLYVHFAFAPIGAKGLDASEVLARLRDPWFQLFYVVFLVLGVFHGGNGVLNVVDDYVRRDTARLVLTWAVWLVGLVTIGIGLLVLTGLPPALH